MTFTSTAGKSPPATAARAVLENIAPDGGLYIPASIPRLPRDLFTGTANRTFAGIGVDVLKPYFEEISELARIVEGAWNFPVPLKEIEEGLFLLELFHGPSLAFKDVGARFLAGILPHLVPAGNDDLTVLVATSGDTGSAVAAGFAGARGVRVVILYPSGRISRLQEHQMATLGGNIATLRVEGNFDDCQALVRKALGDAALRARKRFCSANSINLARLLPQIAHFAWGIFQWMRLPGAGGDPPDLVVPSGNFGNVTAAAYAKRMGVPIGTIIAATNANDVVPRFFASGVYEPSPTRTTLSNAMDVGDPANFARLRAAYGNDLRRMKAEICAVSIDDAETIREIRTTYETAGVILDPHTAVAVAAARKLRKGPVIVAATAHPAKFPETIKGALGVEMPIPPALAEALVKPLLSTAIPPDYDLFKEVILR